MFDGADGYDRTDIWTESVEGDVDESSYIRQKSDAPNMSHIVQVDYSNQFNAKHKLEAGGKVSLSDNKSYSRYYSGADASSLLEDDAQAVKMRQFKDIYAVYASYTGSYSKFGVNAGLRYEHTRMGLRYKIGDYPDFTTYLNDIVPNAALSYNLTDASALRLAYQMRINRPVSGALTHIATLRCQGQYIMVTQTWRASNRMIFQ